MFGSIAVEQWIYSQQAADAEVVAFVGDEIHIPYAPQDAGSPFLVAYRVDAKDETPMGPDADVAAERLQYVVALVAEGNDKRILLRPGRAMHLALQGQSGQLTVNDDQGDPFATYWVVGERVGELPNDEIAMPEDGIDRVTLGGLYEFDVTGA